MKQNFPLKYFYGESANAIKIQIWVTLIANLLLMVMQRGLTRPWSFSVLATMVRINLMYYVDFYGLFNHPEFGLFCSYSFINLIKRANVDGTEKTNLSLIVVFYWWLQLLG